MDPNAKTNTASSPWLNHMIVRMTEEEEEEYMGGLHDMFSPSRPGRSRRNHPFSPDSRSLSAPNQEESREGNVGYSHYKDSEITNARQSDAERIYLFSSTESKQKMADPAGGRDFSDGLGMRGHSIDANHAFENVGYTAKTNHTNLHFSEVDTLFPTTIASGQSSRAHVNNGSISISSRRSASPPSSTRRTRKEMISPAHTAIGPPLRGRVPRESFTAPPEELYRHRPVSASYRKHDQYKNHRSFPFQGSPVRSLPLPSRQVVHPVLCLSPTHATSHRGQRLSSPSPVSERRYLSTLSADSHYNDTCLLDSSSFLPGTNSISASSFGLESRKGNRSRPSDLLTAEDLKAAFRDKYGTDPDVYSKILRTFLSQGIPPTQIPASAHVFFSNPIPVPTLDHEKLLYDEKEKTWKNIVWPSLRPSGRIEVLFLARYFEDSIRKIDEQYQYFSLQDIDRLGSYEKFSEIETARQELETIHIVLSELSRQNFVHCVEQGCLLERMQRRSKDIVESMFTQIQELHRLYCHARDEALKCDEIARQAEEKLKDAELERVWLNEEVASLMSKNSKLQEELDQERNRSHLEKMSLFGRKRGRAIQVNPEDFEDPSILSTKNDLLGVRILSRSQIQTDSPKLASKSASQFDLMRQSMRMQNSTYRLGDAIKVSDANEGRNTFPRRPRSVSAVEYRSPILSSSRSSRSGRRSAKKSKMTSPLHSHRRNSGLSLKMDVDSDSKSVSSGNIVSAHSRVSSNVMDSIPFQESDSESSESGSMSDIAADDDEDEVSVIPLFERISKIRNIVQLLYKTIRRCGNLSHRSRSSAFNSDVNWSIGNEDKEELDLDTPLSNSLLQGEFGSTLTETSLGILCGWISRISIGLEELVHKVSGTLSDLISRPSIKLEDMLPISSTRPETEAFTPLLFTENPPCSTLDCVFPSGNLAPPSITVDTYRTPRISSTTDSAMVSTSDTILSNQMEGLLESARIKQKNSREDLPYLESPVLISASKSTQTDFSSHVGIDYALRGNLQVSSSLRSLNALTFGDNHSPDSLMRRSPSLLSSSSSPPGVHESAQMPSESPVLSGSVSPSPGRLSARLASPSLQPSPGRTSIASNAGSEEVDAPGANNEGSIESTPIARPRSSSAIMYRSHCSPEKTPSDPNLLRSLSPVPTLNGKCVFSPSSEKSNCPDPSSSLKIPSSPSSSRKGTDMNPKRPSSSSSKSRSSHASSTSPASSDLETSQSGSFSSNRLATVSRTAKERTQHQSHAESFDLEDLYEFTQDPSQVLSVNPMLLLFSFSHVGEEKGMNVAIRNVREFLRFSTASEEIPFADFSRRSEDFISIESHPDTQNVSFLRLVISYFRGRCSSVENTTQQIGSFIASVRSHSKEDLLLEIVYNFLSEAWPRELLSIFLEAYHLMHHASSGFEIRKDENGPGFLSLYRCISIVKLSSARLQSSDLDELVRLLGESATQVSRDEFELLARNSPLHHGMRYEDLTGEELSIIPDSLFLSHFVRIVGYAKDIVDL